MPLSVASAEAVAEMVAVTDARPAAADGTLGVGALVATMRVDSTADESLDSASSELCDSDGVADGFVLEAGLLVCFPSPPTDVLVRGRSAGAMSVFGDSCD
tara:strand:+ start:20410 stop:20712 length:303 start_codon:yes stop_codon:yes gene_type:complete